MNSRPLTYGGADHRDAPVLKPNHFLFEQPGWQLAAQVTDDIVLCSWNRWRLNQNLVKFVYRPWREEFLATLNTRRKWRDAKDNLKVGELVLISRQSLASGTSGRSFSMSGWTGSCYPSEQKGPELHPPNKTTVAVELRWPARVRDLELDTQYNMNLFVICKHQGYPLVGYRNQYNKEFCEHMGKCFKCFVAWSESKIEFLKPENIHCFGSMV